jgi:hypothetical protein
MERLEDGVEDRARCLWQEYQLIKGQSADQWEEQNDLFRIL